MLIQVIENSSIHFVTLVEHIPKNSEKYTAVLSFLIKEFENSRLLKKKSQSAFVTPFSTDINTLPANFQVECIELQLDIQIKMQSYHTPLPDVYKTSLTRERYPSS